MLLISFRLNRSFAAQSKAHPQYYIRGLYPPHSSVIISTPERLVWTLRAWMESPDSVFFIRLVLVLVTCFVAAFNSQFARPAPRHSSSIQGGCAVNNLLFKMATRSSAVGGVSVKIPSCAWSRETSSVGPGEHRPVNRSGAIHRRTGS